MKKFLDRRISRSKTQKTSAFREAASPWLEDIKTRIPSSMRRREGDNLSVGEEMQIRYGSRGRRLREDTSGSGSRYIVYVLSTTNRNRTLEKTTWGGGRKSKRRCLGSIAATKTPEHRHISYNPLVASVGYRPRASSGHAWITPWRNGSHAGEWKRNPARPATVALKNEGGNSVVLLHTSTSGCQGSRAKRIGREPVIKAPECLVHPNSPKHPWTTSVSWALELDNKRARPFS